MKKPQLQHTAATTPLFRGPAGSSQRPNNAAERPRKTVAMVKIQASWVWDLSPAADWVMPSTLVSGSLKTLKAYAWPMLRWMAGVAGGTSQRLNPGWATMRELASSPAIIILPG